MAARTVDKEDTVVGRPHAVGIEIANGPSISLS
jgi:hypothetical protein